MPSTGILGTTCLVRFLQYFNNSRIFSVLKLNIKRKSPLKAKAVSNEQRAKTKTQNLQLFTVVKLVRRVGSFLLFQKVRLIRHFSTNKRIAEVSWLTFFSIKDASVQPCCKHPLKQI